MFRVCHECDRDKSSAILSSTRAYPKREPSSGVRQKNVETQCHPLKGHPMGEFCGIAKATP